MKTISRNAVITASLGLFFLAQSALAQQGLTSFMPEDAYRVRDYEFVAAAS